MKGIKKLKSGRYQARYFAGYDSKGKRIYPSKTFKSHGDALKWRNARVHEKDTGISVEANTLSVSDYLDRWWKTKEPELRPNSRLYYEHALENYIKPVIGEVRLSGLRPAHIQDWQDGLKLRASSIRTVRAILNSAIAKAVRWQFLFSNPMKGTDAPRKVKREMNVLSPEQAAEFLSCLPGERFGLVFKCSLKLGLRPEELIGLQWKCLEFGKRGICKVSRVITRIKGGGWAWGDPKTKSGFRSVTFPASLVTELREHHRKQLEDRMRAGQHYKHLDLVFSKPNGDALTHGLLVDDFKKIAARAGLLSEFRLYDLRHSFVTLSLLAGVDIKTVSYEAGHSSVAFTLDTYGHVLKQMQEAASDKRERLFAGAVKRHSQNVGGGDEI